MSEYYYWFLALHIISVICWMAGIFYLPRLYVYHTKVQTNSEADILLREMERKLLRIIINPAMISTIIFGVILSYIYGLKALGVWFHIKCTAVAFLLVFHGFMARCRRQFADCQNHYSEKFYRIINEVPVFLMIIIVIMVVLKPFD